MNRTLSIRVDESVLDRISDLAGQLNVSKRSVIEQAVTAFAAKVESERRGDILDQTFGAWQRQKPLKKTVRRARAVFRVAMERHQR